MAIEKKIVSSLIACAFATAIFVTAPVITDGMPTADQAQTGQGEMGRAYAYKVRKPKRTLTQHGWERWSDNAWRKHDARICPAESDIQDKNCLPLGIAGSF